MNRMIVDLQEFVRESAKLYGKRDAYRYIENDVVVGKTFLDLERDTNAIASWFVKEGWCGKHIAIIGSSSYNWITAFLGITCSANVVIPIDRMLPEEDILGLLSMGDADMVFISEEFKPLAQKILHGDNPVTEVVCFSDARFSEILSTKHTKLPKIDPNALTEILFTSGTTGVSKGVMLCQKNIVSNINDIYRMDYAQNVKSDPVVMSVLPIHHTFELTVDNLGVLYCGATVCINDKLENILKNFRRFKPSVILVVPTIAEIFYKRIQETISTGKIRRKVNLAKKVNSAFRAMHLDVRRRLYRSLLDKFGGNLTNIIVGGAALRPEVAEGFSEFGINMYQGYGLTECAPLISANYPKKNKVGSVGKPISYMDVKIENGEILVKGAGVMLGYYKNPEATAETIDADGWLHTGDLGYFDGDGYLYITGRSKNLIVLGNGKNIYPEELEGNIAVIDGVKDVMVYESKGMICAAVQPVDINNPDLIKNIKESIKEINAKQPSYKRIVSVVFIARDFPKTTTMKIKRKEALRMIKEAVSKRTVAHVPPKTAEQKKIIKAFEKVLGCRGIGIKDDFFDIGGDSLTALEVAVVIGVQAQDIYDNPTAEQLEKVLLSAEVKAITERSASDNNELIRHNADVTYECEAKCILLTGATGFLGSHILSGLLKKSKNVICLVRDEEKLKSILKYYFPKTYKRFKYTVVKGDIRNPNLGLSDENYEALVEKVDMVIHTAANVSHTGQYADFEKTNVIGTQNVIDFCMRAGAVLQHTSTASVHGSGTVEQKNPDAVFDEFSLDIGQNYTQNVYIHSKFKAEERVLLARKEGLRANIFRIGNLTWRHSDGRFQKNAQDNGFLGRYRGLVKVGVYSRAIAEYPIDFTPVDECADAYIRLALHNKINNIYHLYNPDVFTIERISKMAFLKLNMVSQQLFDKTIKETVTDKDVAVLAFYNSIASLSKNIQVSNDFTVDMLSKLKFKWSKVGIGYLRHVKKIP